MNFQKGDMVMHWTYGIGQIVNLEERAISGSKLLYYAVHVQDMTVWVPADGKVADRLRTPTSKLRFKQLISILSGSSEPLPEDRLERRTHLHERMKDGSVASLCQVIRDLSAYKKEFKMNENDTIVLKQSLNTLLGEWEFVLAVPHAQANLDLHRLLASGSLESEASPG
jgi:RNA polymerase-interacting CarD/CdnL/TRCF family regulator